jgi:hypothetical protein
MKSVARFSAWVAFAALLCFASSAFGQGTANLKINAGNRVLTYAPPSFLTFTFGPGGDHRSGDPAYGGNNSGNNGCGNQGGGWGGGGWNDQGWGGGNGGGGCTPVPEGGTSLMYIFLAGSSCFGAMLLRSRRQSHAPKTN